MEKNELSGMQAPALPGKLLPWPPVKQKTLWITIGLPYSGKSTWALSTGMPIVCPDAIRAGMLGQRYYSDAEDMVWAVAKIMVMSLFAAGHDEVIVDATHTTARRRDFWKNMHWRRLYVVMDISPHMCHDRAVLAEDDEILPVIERMNNQLEFEGVHYGTGFRYCKASEYTPVDLMADHMQLTDTQLYHKGSAGD